jgi:hypothetical protein
VTGVDVEVARAALVIGLVFAALAYHFLGIVSGGAVTGSYLALLLLGGDWIDIMGWAVLSLVGVAAIRITANRWPLPRAWLFGVGIFVPAALHALLVWIADVGWFNQWSDFLVAGLYITNGLTAYDAQRQGIGRTFFGAVLVAVLTYLVMIPVEWGMLTVREGEPLLSAPTLQHPLVVLACVAIALSVRIGLKLGTAGIIGALFFVEMGNLTSAVVVLAFALIGTLIFRLVERALGLTPRQRLYSLMAVGAIVSWFGLFWAEWWGVPGAEIAHGFAVEPLLIIGLMMGEMVRFGIPRMLSGSALVFGLTWLAYYLSVAHPASSAGVLVAALLISLAFMVWGYRNLSREWTFSLRGGNRWAQRAPVGTKVEKPKAKESRKAQAHG